MLCPILNRVPTLICGSNSHLPSQYRYAKAALSGDKGCLLMLRLGMMVSSLSRLEILLGQVAQRQSMPLAQGLAEIEVA